MDELTECPDNEPQRQLIEARAQRRAVLREEFMKQSTNPFKHASGEGGTVFDPAIQRFIAMKVNTYEHFRPTPKNALMALAALVIPMAGYAYLLKSERDCKEKAYRTGQVAYKDRNFKFI